MDRGYTTKQFFSLFDTATADKQVPIVFDSEFGLLYIVPQGRQFRYSVYKM
jgi:hypothetical protein